MTFTYKLKHTQSKGWNSLPTTFRVQAVTSQAGAIAAIRNITDDISDEQHF